MIRNSDFIKRKIGTQFVIVATGAATKAFNGMISVNGTGSVIWDKLEADLSLDELADAIVAEYEVTREIAMADATAFVEKLMGVGAIVK
jgi:hypothetical protein